MLSLEVQLLVVPSGADNESRYSLLEFLNISFDDETQQNLLQQKLSDVNIALVSSNAHSVPQMTLSAVTQPCSTQPCNFMYRIGN